MEQTKGTCDSISTIIIKEEVCSDEENVAKVLESSRSNSIRVSQLEIKSSNIDFKEQDVLNDLESKSPFHVKVEINVPDSDVNYNSVYMKEEDLSDHEDNEEEDTAVNIYDSTSDSISELKYNGLLGASLETMGTSHEVFVKEERVENSYYENNPCDLNVTHDKLVDDSFGQHFLTQCIEPRYQYANGQSAEMECEELPNIDPLEAFESSSADRKSADGKKNARQQELTEDGLIIYHPQPWIEDRIPRKSSRQKMQISLRQPKNIPCPHCTFRARYKGQLDTHMSIYHNSYDPYRCTYCPYESPYKCAVKQHIVKRHNFGDKLLDCPYCKFQTLSFLQLCNHVEKKHRPQAPYTCPYCQWKLNGDNKWNIERHIAVHHTKEVRYKCGNCDFKCWAFVDMKTHYKSHK